MIFIIILDILHYITDFAVKYSTKHINGVGADTLIPLQSCDLSGTDIILLDKGILRDAFLFHNVPEVIIRNHSNQPPSLLDMITECGV